MTERGLKKDLDYWTKTWKPKHNELCKEHNIELLAAGTPFGTDDDTVFLYEIDKPLDEFFEFRMKVVNIGEETLVAHTRTITVLKL